MSGVRDIPFGIIKYALLVSLIQPQWAVISYLVVFLACRQSTQSTQAFAYLDELDHRGLPNTYGANFNDHVPPVGCHLGLKTDIIMRYGLCPTIALVWLSVPFTDVALSMGESADNQAAISSDHLLDNKTTAVVAVEEVEYHWVTNVTIGGQRVILCIDTGSSPL